MHLITQDNYLEAVEAIRDILLMYVKMADEYNGFGHLAGADSRFDPLRFIDAETYPGAQYVDLDLLQSGSAITVLQWYYDLWLEERGPRGNAHGARFEAALMNGRFAAFPDIEAVLREALSRNDMPLDDPWFDLVAAPIYRRYVKSFFQRLANADREA